MSDALIAGLSGVAANAPGRAPGQGATVLGGQGQTDEDKWNELDAKVNEYPMLRSFKAIGTGGDAFAAAMAVAAAGALARAPLAEEQIVCRPSRGGKYVAVTLGPLRIESPEELKSVYAAMKEDNRLRYFL